jgi:cytoskeletal protein CcmA (bactofilin family)
MAEVRIKDIDEHEIDTILAEDIDFEGYLTFKKPLMIKGKFKGEIKSTSALYIGEKAYVEATTEAAVVSSKGRHKGDIVGHSRIELYSTAQVDGDITTPDFVMESGCRFNGYCNMGGGGPDQAAPSSPASTPASTSAPHVAAPPQPSAPASQAAPASAPHSSQPGGSQQGQSGGGQQGQQHGGQQGGQQGQQGGPQRPGGQPQGQGGGQK